MTTTRQLIHFQLRQADQAYWHAIDQIFDAFFEAVIKFNT